MPTLLEYLSRDENRWGIQVLQQTLALLSNVPLRLIDREKVMEEASRVGQAVGSGGGDFLRELGSDILAHSRDHRIWVTAPLKIHPLMDYLRRDQTWVACERMFVCDWLAGLANGQQVAESKSYFSDEMTVAACGIEIGDFSGFLVAGPVFTAPLVNDSPPNFHETVGRFVEKVMQAYGDLGIDHDLLPNEMNLRGRSTGWMYRNCLMEDTALLAKMLTNIFSLPYDPQTMPDFKNVSYNVLAQTVYLLDKDLAPGERRLPGMKDGDRLLTQLDRREHIVLEATLSESRWNYSLWQDAKLGPKRISIRGSIENDSATLQDAEDTALRKAGELGQSFAYRFHGYAGQKVKRLSRWLHSAFGVISADLDPNEPALEEAYRGLAGRIERLFNADMVSVFLYDHPSETLVPKLIHVQGQHATHEDRSRLSHKATALMREAADDKDGKRKQSISYRAVDTLQPRYCKAFFPDEQTPDRVSDPAGETILNLYMGPVVGRSAMAVPIMINGLVFGVLEIEGCRPYQFRRDFLQLAQEIADILGPFLYQREMLANLAKINEIALDEKAKDEDRHRRICEHAARIFLADSAALWIPPLARPMDYELKGYFNRDDWDSILTEGSGTYLLGEETDDSPAIRATRLRATEDRYIFFTRLAEWEKEFPGWRDRHPLRKRSAEKFEHIAVVPVVDHRSQRPLCALTLYYAGKDKGCPDPSARRWQYTARFMADYVAITVAAINTRRRVEDQMLRILGHEIDNLQRNVGYIGKAVIAAWKSAEREEGQRWLDDLEGTIEWMTRFTKLYRQDEFRKLVASGSSPIEFLYSEGYMDDHAIKMGSGPEKISLKFHLLGHGMHFLSKYSTGQKWDLDLDQLDDSFIVIRKEPFTTIIINLLLNAVRYGKTYILFRAEKKEDHFRISVINDGKCLKDSAEEDEIWGFGIRGSNKENVQGTGAGLHVVSAMARILQLTANCRIQPEQSGGCRFEFFLLLPFSRFLPSK